MTIKTDQKVVQIKIDRNKAKQFKMLCVQKGITQKHQLEKWITTFLNQHQGVITQ